MMLLQWQLYLFPRQGLVVCSGLSNDCGCTVDHVSSSIPVAVTIACILENVLTFGIQAQVALLGVQYT